MWSIEIPDWLVISEAPRSGASAIEYTNVEALQELLGPRYINMVVSWGKLYRTSLFDGVRFPEGRFHEDEFTTHKLLYRANRVVLTETPLYFYWQRPGSITSSYSHRSRVDVREAFRARASFLMRAGLADQGNATYTKAFWMLVRDRRRTRGSAANRQLQKVIDREIRELRNEVWASSSASELKLRVLVYSLVPEVMDWLAIFKEENLPPPFGSEPRGEVG